MKTERDRDYYIAMRILLGILRAVSYFDSIFHDLAIIVFI